MQEPSVKDYFCFRTYLGDFFEYKKTQNPYYSYRVFASRAGLKSSGHLKMIINRERNIGPKTMPMYLKALNFSDANEEKFFKLLVKYDQSRSVSDKTEMFTKILQEKNKATSNQLEIKQYNLLSQWYVVTSYVLIGVDRFYATVDSIYNQLVPRVSRVQIEKAINLLLDMELIAVADGRFVQSGGAFSTPDRIKAVAVNRYHESMVSLSLESLKRDKPEDRNFNGVTVAVGEENYNLICKKLNDLRREINEMVSDDKEATKVYQLCVNLFPLTKGIE